MKWLNFVWAEQHNPFSVGDLVKTKEISLIPVEKDLWMVNAMAQSHKNLEVAKVPEGRFQHLDTAFPPLTELDTYEILSKNLKRFYSYNS